MADVLILSDEVPLPIQANGQSLRLNPVIHHLAERHHVDLVVVGDRRPDARELADQARDLCRDVVYVARPDVPRLRRWSRTLRAFTDPHRAPWEELDPFSDDYIATVRRVVESRSYDAVLALSGVNDLLGRLLDHPALADTRTVIDWVDAPSLHHERRTQGQEGVAGRIARARTQALVEWQKALNARLDAAIYIAEADRAHAREGENPNVHILANGVLPGPVEVPPRNPDRPPTIGFLGNMSYGPNIRAALRLHNKVYRPLKAEIPDLRLHIIGRLPAPEIEALASDHVEVTGAVPSIWPALAEVDVMVFPMETGGGLQNKVLEAIAGGCAVVVTPVGAAGTGQVGLEALEIAETDADIRACVTALFEDQAHFDASRDRARGLLDHFRWDTILPRYERVLLGDKADG